MAICCFLISMLNGGSLMTVGILLPEIITGLDTTEMATSWIGSMQIAVTLASGKSYYFFRANMKDTI